jgi:hypothetical protein
MAKKSNAAREGRSKQKHPQQRIQPTVIAGETGPDAHNADVQQSQKLEENEGDPWGDQQNYGNTDRSPGDFTAGELGEPGPDEELQNENNPQGVQGGRGPISQDGEGNRQNDELAELEQIPHVINLDKTTDR